MTRRMDRINVLLRQEISRILLSEISDPRVSALASVTHVDASPDLGHARVYISVLGSKTEKNDTIHALRAAAGFINRSMRKGLDFKKTPVLEFLLDESIERGSEVLELIKENAPQDTDGGKE